MSTIYLPLFGPVKIRLEPSACSEFTVGCFKFCYYVEKNVCFIVGFFIFVSTCILERVFSHLEGMCSDCK